MGDEDVVGEALANISKDIAEAGCIGNLAGADSMDAGWPEVAIRAEKGRPAIDDRAGSVGRKQGQLDDPVLCADIKAGRLAINDYGRVPSPDSRPAAPLCISTDVQKG